MNKTIIVEMYQGLISEVKNLPEGWNYKIEILDEQSVCLECGEPTKNFRFEENTEIPIGFVCEPCWENKEKQGG